MTYGGVGRLGCVGLVLLAFGCSSKGGTPEGSGSSSGGSGSSDASSGGAESAGADATTSSGTSVVESGDASTQETSTPPVDASPDVNLGDGGGYYAPSAACQTMTASLLAQMTRLEKAGQMVMADDPPAGQVTANAPGAVFAPGGSEPPTGSDVPAWATMIDAYVTEASHTRLKIPIFYGLDAVHGNNGATGTVIFPHNAGMASSRNASFVQQVTQITASETMAAGINWVFSPFSGTTWDYQWGRVYESFSDDPTWAGEMLAGAVKGLQGAGGLGTGSPGVVACSKHWAGDGQATPGSSNNGGVVDRGNSQITLSQMEQYGIAPYVPAFESGLACVMVSDARWNGQGMTSSYELVTTLLKDQYKFQGFVITDWNAATGVAGGIVPTVNAGVDMLMQPADWVGAINTIANAVPPPPCGSDAGAEDAGCSPDGGVDLTKYIPESRIDDAVSRILNVKCQYGLFNYKRDPSLMASVGSAAHRTIGRQAVRQSLVLLQNTGNVLPLQKSQKIWIGGSGADNLNNQCGGWTLAWQGSGGLTQGTTIVQALRKVTTPTVVEPDAGVDAGGTFGDADVAIVVLSESPYAEFEGDRVSINTLPPSDFALLAQARAAGLKVVAIVMSGRPVLITSELPDADAWIAAWLPGTEGDGVVDFLYGQDENANPFHPTSKLSHSWPMSDPPLPDTMVSGYSALFPLGFGLTY